MHRRLVLAWIVTAVAVVPLAHAEKSAVTAARPVVLLAGATGKNGSVILAALKGTPYTVRAMTRDKKSALEKFGAGPQWVEADVTKPETLPAVFQGVDYVIDAVAATGIMGDNKPEKVDYEGTRHLAAAAKAAGVKRFVIITSAISGNKDSFLNVIGNNVIVFKGKAEEELIASGVPYTIIGPSGMNNDPAGTKEIRLIRRSDYKSGMAITRGDVALVAIEALTNPEAAGRAFTVFNGEGPATPDWKHRFAELPAK